MVKGKLLCDTISTIALLKLRNMLCDPGISVCYLIGNTQSLKCTRKKDGTVIVEIPNIHVKDFNKELMVKVPSSVNFDTFKIENLKLHVAG